MEELSCEMRHQGQTKEGGLIRLQENQTETWRGEKQQRTEPGFRMYAGCGSESKTETVLSEAGRKDKG